MNPDTKTTPSAIDWRTFDEFTQAYLECALWSSNDNADDSGGEPLDANYDFDDIDQGTLASMRDDCEAFQSSNRVDLDDSGLSLARQGHDFWLNRNRHGSGFWDEGGLPLFRRLSANASGYGTVDLYVGDDGKIYS